MNIPTMYKHHAPGGSTNEPREMAGNHDEWRKQAEDKEKDGWMFYNLD